MGTEGEDDGASMEALTDDVIIVSNGPTEDAVHLPKNNSSEGIGERKHFIISFVNVGVCLLRKSLMV